MAKLESVYGVVEDKESILASFYSARQGEHEDVSSWSCRLEDILAKAVHKGEIGTDETDMMLKSMLWAGLRQSLKDISGHKNDACSDFDSLRVSLRQLEHDQKQRKQELGSKKPYPAKAVTKSDISDQSEMSEIKGMIQQLSAEVAAIKQQVALPRPEGSYTYMPKYDSGKAYQNKAAESGTYGQQQQTYKREQGDARSSQSSSFKRNKAGETPQNQQNEIICWKCGQPGHIRKGCRANVDCLRKQPLN